MSATLTQQWVCSASHCCCSLPKEGLVMTSRVWWRGLTVAYKAVARSAFCRNTRCISGSSHGNVCVNRSVTAATRIGGLDWWTASGVAARLRYYSRDVTCRENKWTCMSKREMLKSRPIEIEKAYKLAAKYGSAVIPAGSTTRWF